MGGWGGVFCGGVVGEVEKEVMLKGGMVLRETITCVQ